MDLLSSSPFWPIQNGLPASNPTLHADRACEVVVIGAGISGALAAWHPADAGRVAPAFSPVVSAHRA